MADRARPPQAAEPPLARPGAWAGLWRQIGVKAALAIPAG